MSTRSFWDLSERPEYLLGVIHGARRALRDGVEQISVIEFGVAGGSGLLVLEHLAARVEEELGVTIKVFGFDNGQEGLPPLIGDYRDHPDKWRAGDFPMDEPLLRSKLAPRTKLILGNVANTVVDFYKDHTIPPIGFVAFDLDLYSSTAQALRILSVPERRMLSHVPLYFDDIEHSISHRFAGELLAIDEFNATNDQVKIDHWRGLKNARPFPEAPYLQRMFMAHDLSAVSRHVQNREPLLRSLSHSVGVRS
jgi:hypothetical protein